MKKISLLLLSFAFIVSAYSQEKQNTYASYPYWIDMMKDREANFFETQKAFYAYTADKDKETMRGYKQFKRWEWFMRSRVDKDGNRQDPKMIMRNYKGFIDTYGKVKNNSNWTNLGPVELPNQYISSPTGLGRINAIGFHPNNPNELLIGSPSGGLWKTTDLGENWECLSDAFPTLGVSAIAYDPENPLVIYIGSGDRDADDAPGLGIMKTTNGGDSWEFINDGLGDHTVSKIMINPQNTAIVYAATNFGFYRSEDGGSSWQRKRDGEFLDFQLKPGNPNVVYASRYGAFTYSTDGGNSWQFSNILINGRRLVLGVSPANPNYVYVLSTNQRTFKGFYFSKDSGASFELMSDTPNIMGRRADGSDDDGQSWYDLCLAADRDDPDVVYAGGIQIWKSEDNGASWAITAHDRYDEVDNVHVDHHFMDFSPINGHIFNGNDGGIYYSPDKGETWTDITGGLAISQIYKLGQSATNRGLVMCGYQDNSTTIYRSGDFTTVIGADGMECLVDYADTSYKYGCIQYGNIRRSYGPNSFRTIAGTGVNGITEDGDWVTPYMLHTTNPNIMFAGYYNLWRTKHVRNSNFNITWHKISNNLGNSNSSYIIDIEQSKVNDDILYISRADGKLFRSDNINDDNPTWSSISAIGGYYVITDIKAHPYDEDIVYATKANGNVYKSADRGYSWYNITYNLPNVNFNCLVLDKTSNEGIYVGTDAGIYYKDDLMDEWILFSNNLPVSAEITELEIFYHPTNRAESRLRASTYGRGLWSSPLYQIQQDDIVADAAVEEFSIEADTVNRLTQVAPVATLKNVGTDTIQTIAIQLLLDNDTIQEMEIAEQLIPLATYELIFSQVSATFGKHLFETIITAVNEQVDKDADNNRGIDSLFVNTTNYLKIEFVSDSLASETSWEIVNDEGSLFTSPDNFTNGSIVDTALHYPLEEGCYTLFVYDEGNDGMCCDTGNGELKASNFAMDTLFGTVASFTTKDSILFCIDSVDLPVVDFSIEPDYQEVCIDENLAISNNTEGEVLTYDWNFGTGAILLESDPVVGSQVINYHSSGYKTISLTATAEQGKVTETKKDFVYVIPEMEIMNQTVKNVEKCAGDSLKLFIDATHYNTVDWINNDGSLLTTEASIILEDLSEEDSGIYYAVLRNDCDSLISDTIRLAVYPQPDVTINTESTTFCAGESITLTATGADHYEWSASADDTSQIVVAPEASKVYSVTGTNNYGCTNTAYIALTLLINPELTKDLADSNYCHKENVSLYVGAQGNQLNYAWYKDNEAIEGNNSPFLLIDSIDAEHAGTYKCAIFNACTEIETSEAEIGIQYLPTVDFSYVLNDYVASFTSENENASYFYWAFGDDAFSEEENPEHDYIRPGTYPVLHKAINACGFDQANDTIIIWPLSIAELEETQTISIFPNPNSGEFEIFSHHALRNAKLEIIGMNGKLIKQIDNLNKHFEEPIKISLPDIENGIYLLYLYSNDDAYFSFFVITK